MRRRDLLTFIGMTAGASVMQQAMTALDLEAASTYKGPIKLDGDPKGASVIILGAGLSGMVAALELRRAGYNVQVLEYQHRAGGRCWSIRGGDRYTELGGFSQTCEFDAGLYLNPGPWRIPELPASHSRLTERFRIRPGSSRWRGRCCIAPHARHVTCRMARVRRAPAAIRRSRRTTGFAQRAIQSLSCSTARARCRRSGISSTPRRWRRRARSADFG